MCGGVDADGCLEGRAVSGANHPSDAVLEATVSTGAELVGHGSTVGVGPDGEGGLPARVAAMPASMLIDQSPLDAAGGAGFVLGLGFERTAVRHSIR
jgi:hypothetical protein